MARAAKMNIPFNHAAARKAAPKAAPKKAAPKKAAPKKATPKRATAKKCVPPLCWCRQRCEAGDADDCWSHRRARMLTLRRCVCHRGRKLIAMNRAAQRLVQQRRAEPVRASAARRTVDTYGTAGSTAGGSGRHGPRRPASTVGAAMAAVQQQLRHLRHPAQVRNCHECPCSCVQVSSLAFAPCSAAKGLMQVCTWLQAPDLSALGQAAAAALRQHLSPAAARFSDGRQAAAAWLQRHAAQLSAAAQRHQRQRH